MTDRGRPPTDASTLDTVVPLPGLDATLPSSKSPEARVDYPDLVTVSPDHYVDGNEIARGGMGRIRTARDRRLGRVVAVKEILVGADRVARLRFEREARITARLQHPSIVNIHEAGVWPSGEPFYAMKLVTGRSLDDVIASAPTLEARIALLPNILAIADAMAYAHGQRVIHRDLKPRNVLIGAFGETVVIDWGLGKDLSDGASDLPAGSESGTGDAGMTSAGDVMGTPAYMPPEQAAGCPVDERADVYAIGAILDHALSGKPPPIAHGEVALSTRVDVHGVVLSPFGYPLYGLLERGGKQPNAPPPDGISDGRPSANPKVMAMMKSYRDAMCACSTETCAQKVSASVTVWASESGAPTSLTEAQKAEVATLTKELSDCMSKATMPR